MEFLAKNKNLLVVVSFLIFYQFRTFRKGWATFNTTLLTILLVKETGKSLLIKVVEDIKERLRKKVFLPKKLQDMAKEL
jgi:hypothetical protein